jgi:hypothetical protein
VAKCLGYTKTKLITLLRNDILKNGIMSKPQVKARLNVSVSTFEYHFGTWSNALKKAGFEPIKSFPSPQCLRAMIAVHKGRHGADTPNWKGGRILDKTGYVWIRQPNHPNANLHGYALEHRLVMAKSLGRSLNSNETVHHLNGIKIDNRLCNLKIVSNSIHSKIHYHNTRLKMLAGFKPKRCIFPECKNIYYHSKYKLCQHHYQLQLNRLKRHKIRSYHDWSFRGCQKCNATLYGNSKLCKKHYLENKNAT